MLKRKTFLRIFVGFLAVAIVGMAFAQPTRRSEGERGGRGGRGGFSGFGGRGGGPEQFLQMMTERMKDRLEVGDDEWKVIQPRLSKVMSLQFEVASAGRGGFGRGGFGGTGRGGSGREAGRGGPRGGEAGRGGPRGGGEGAREMNATQAASQALSEVLEQGNASPDQIRAKLTALRAAKEGARQKLAAAQKELREVLTLKQEARLVLGGQLN